MKSYLNFEGGPLDGATMTLAGDDLWIGEIRVCLPVKGPDDKGDVATSQTVHSYVCCHSTEFEGSNQVSHYMGHCGVIREKQGSSGQPS